VEADQGSNTAATLLASRRGRRVFVPIARGFLQHRGDGDRRGPGPLSWFVKAHRERALKLYLFAHALASAEPYDVALTARTWANVLGLPESPSARVSISESWSWIERHKLVHTERDGRLRRVWLLDDTGTGGAYSHGATDAHGGYFKLPFAYWTQAWDQRLDLPATAVLLIALSLRRTFILPQRQGGDWYGISRDTIRRGLNGLVRHELLTVRSSWRTAQASPTGATEDRRYALTGAFAVPLRRARSRPNRAD